MRIRLITQIGFSNSVNPLCKSIRFRCYDTFSSFTSIVPDPSVSNRSKASLISCLCSSVSSGLGPALFLWLLVPLGFLKLEASNKTTEKT